MRLWHGLKSRLRSLVFRMRSSGRSAASGSRTSSSTSSAAICSTSWNTLTPAVTPGIFAVRREDYVYLVPLVEDEHTVFLKTVIPSRKATKENLGEESDDED